MEQIEYEVVMSMVCDLCVEIGQEGGVVERAAPRSVRKLIPARDFLVGFCASEQVKSWDQEVCKSRADVPKIWLLASEKVKVVDG
jgi:hypothetical protein